MLKNLPLDKNVIQNAIKKYSNVKVILKALINELIFKIEELSLL